MKEIRETKLVEQTTVKFIAKDGKEFAHEEECLRHERMCDIKAIKEHWARIPKQDISNKMNTINSKFGYYESTIYKVTVNNLDELRTIVDYHKLNNRFINDEDIIYPDTYPCTMIVCNQDDWLINYLDITHFIEKLSSMIETLKS